MPDTPENSTTSKLGLWKLALSGICLIGGIVFAATGNIPVGLALIAVAGQGGVSGAIGMKAQDAPKKQ